MANMIKQRYRWKIITSWVFLILVWVCTPFIGDKVPACIVLAYCVLSPTVVAFGLYVAWTKRNVILAIASILTMFSWLIILVVGLILFGI